MYSRAYYVLEEDSLLYYRLYVKLLEKIYLYFHDIGVCNESETAFKERMLKLYISASSPQEYAASLSTETARMVAENQLSADSRSTPPYPDCKAVYRRALQRGYQLIRCGKNSKSFSCIFKQTI